MKKIRGCVPIICTPFDDDGALDLPSLEREVDWVIAEGASGVAALAIASEGFKLTEREREEVTRTVVSAAGGRVPVVVSADGGGPEVAIDRAVRYEALGADAVMVLPPYFVKPDQSALFDYYRRIGEAISIPVVIQDAPQLTGVPMGPALWARLADAVETIRYVKAEGLPQGNTLTEAMRQSNGKLEVLCGWAGVGMIDAMERGAAGSMPAPNFTRLFADIQRLWEAGDRAGANARFNAELPFVVWSIQGVEYSVGAAKEEMRRRGVIASAHIRQPRGFLDEVSMAQMAAFIDARIG